MLGLAADENFNNDIIRGLLRRKPDLNLVRVQDAGLSGSDDPVVLEWAARRPRLFYHVIVRTRQRRKTLTEV